MSIAVGDIVEGKVTGITNFGAFVALPEGKNGLIHISEISRDYVEKVEDYLKRDDVVKVKILTISGDGKISLSIRQAEKPKKKEIIKQPAEVSFEKPEEELSFEDMMNKFLKDSNDRFDDIKSRDGKRGAGQRYRARNANY
ncbi:S1 RNA-binding domain-containing protein [Microaceticoccus formicicus]|uniref:S1 RNA-binding domain-containing protein n=1 Tax=Microaceticoccus formicicus TaxID=3118105 RepID=UPI003CD04F41|nr:S1 RNA-binding domain-containing protein [Peptoniphilaceae bacterium AMB_02]